MLIHNPSSVRGVVLVGGQSHRFGSPKALFAVNNKPMARVVAEIMRLANIEEVFVVGDSQITADAIGLTFVADSYPGQGPLGGLITALRAVSTGILCVLPCDVPRISANRIAVLIKVLIDIDETDLAILMTDREHWLCSSWRVSTCLPVLEKCFAEGERAIHRAVGSLSIERVPATKAEMLNVNTLQQAREIGRIATSENAD